MKTIIVISSLFLIHFLANGQDSISVRDIYNFDVGDEFHYNDYNPAERSSYKLIILSKSFSSNNDTVFYTASKFGNKTVCCPTYSSFDDTINFYRIGLNSYYYGNIREDTCWLQQDSITTACKGNYDSVTVSNYNGRLASKQMDYNQNAWDGFYYYSTTFNSLYVIGLGVAVYSSSYVNNFSSPQGVYNQLVYYKKGSEIWGTPLVLGVKENQYSRDNKLSIYPNPTSGNLYVSAEGDKAINAVSIYGIQGNQIKSLVLNQKKQMMVFEIDDLSCGMYIVNVLFDDGSVINKKILKE